MIFKRCVTIKRESDRMCHQCRPELMRLSSRQRSTWLWVQIPPQRFFGANRIAPKSLAKNPCHSRCCSLRLSILSQPPLRLYRTRHKISEFSSKSCSSMVGLHRELKFDQQTTQTLTSSSETDGIWKLLSVIRDFIQSPEGPCCFQLA